MVVEAPPRIKAKIFYVLLKSKFGAQIFPQNLQVSKQAYDWSISAALLIGSCAVSKKILLLLHSFFSSIIRY